MTRETGLSTLLELRNALIVNIKEPTPGPWLIELSAQSDHTVRVTGLSSLDFVHGFSLRPTLALSETRPQPTKGQRSLTLTDHCVSVCLSVCLLTKGQRSRTLTDHRLCLSVCLSVCLKTSSWLRGAGN